MSIIDSELSPLGGRPGREASLDLLLAEELANDLGLLGELVSCIDRDRTFACLRGSPLAPRFG